MYKKIYLIFKLMMISFFCHQSLMAQVSLTNTNAVVEAFTGFAGAATPTNWSVAGTGSRGTTWNGSATTSGASGGWYGNSNMGFLGSSSASAGNGTWILQNNSGNPFSGFSLSVLAKLTKSGTSSPTVTVSWSKSTSATVPAAGALANTLTSLNFSDATSGITTGTTLTQAVSNITIANGEYVFIRFIHSGGSNSDILCWDDVTFTPVSSTLPFISVNKTAVNLGKALVGDSTSADSFEVGANNITADVKVQAPAGFKVSLDNIVYTDFVMLARTGTDLVGEPVKVYTRLFPTLANGRNKADAVLSTTGATDKTVSLVGYGLSNEPTTLASNIAVNQVTATTASIQLVKGDGASRIIVVSANAPVTFIPTDTVTYSGINASFSLATDRGSANKIVYSGVDTFVNVTGLSSGSVYYVTAYEYNVGTGASINYASSAPSSVSFTTTPAAITNLASVKTTINSIQLTWTKPSGTFGTQWDGVVLVASASAVSNAVLDGVDANLLNDSDAVFGKGSQIGNSFVVANYILNQNGTINVTGLTPNTTYSFKAYTYKLSGSGVDVWSVSSDTISASARVEDVISFEPIGGLDSLIDISWVARNNMGVDWDETFVFASTQPISFTPSGNGSTWSASTYFGDSIGLIAPGVFMVYKGIGSNVLLDSVLNDSVYYVKSFTRKDSFWSVGVEKMVTVGGASKRWDGGAGTNLWSDANNWNPNGTPTKMDRILLDNKFVAGNYDVQLPTGTVSTIVDQVIIKPNQAIITLTLPVTNTLLDSGLRVTNTTDAMIIYDGGVFISASNGTTAGDGFRVDGDLKIFNGGRFVHNNQRAFTDLVPYLSIVGGTEFGIFEVDFPTTTTSYSLPVITYGSLVLNRTANTTTITYGASGNTDLIIRGNFELKGSHVRLVATIGGSAEPRKITIGGDLTNLGLFQWSPSTAANHELVFNGKTTQKLIGNGTLTFGSNLPNLTIDGAGIRLFRSSFNMNVPNIKLVNGSIWLGNTNLEVPNATVISSLNGNYIITDSNGVFTQTVGAGVSKVFPIGTASAYHPVTISQYASSVSDKFSTRVKPQVANTDTGSTIMNSKVVDATWFINKTNASVLFDAELGWNSVQELAGFDRTQAYVGTYANYTWTIDSARSANGAVNAWSILIDSLNSNVVLAVGSGNSALPVRMLHFNGKLQSSANLVKLQWATASEINAQQFVIERSFNGIDFVTVGFVEAKGSSNNKTEYQFYDNVSSTDRQWYYRLKQIDFDGKFEYSSVIILSRNTVNGNQSFVYPNPTSNEATVKLNSTCVGNVKIDIVTANGILVKTLYHYISSSDVNEVKLPELDSGLYFIVITTNMATETLKFVVSK